MYVYSASLFIRVTSLITYRLLSPAHRLFVQQFVQATIKEPSKLRVTGPLWGESTGDRWIPITKGQ